MDYIGIDISQWQGNIDWRKVKQAGTQFVIIRDGYGTTQDPRFRAYVTGAKAAGLDIRGTYHFIYSLNETQARAEADKAVEFVSAAGLPQDAYIFCDFEYDTERFMKQYGVNPNKSLCTKITQVFCKRIEENGYKAGIYLNQDYANRMYTKEILSKYPLWLADYEGDEAFPCLVRQYSSHGAVSGISGNVDIDIWHSKSTTVAKKPHIEYAVKTRNHGILPFVRDGRTAGKANDSIVGIAIRAINGGRVKYRVHTTAGRWLGEITGCDWNDYYNGFAGNNKDSIDAIQIYYYTDTSETGGAYYTCKYRVKNCDADKYLSWITDTNFEPYDGNETAGAFGNPIAYTQIKLERV